MSSNGLEITPTLSSVNKQQTLTQKSAAKTSSIKTQNQSQKPAQNSDSTKPAQKTKKGSTKKILITAGLALAALAGIYAIAKSGKGKEKVQEAAQNVTSEITQNNKATNAAESMLDKLDYEIKEPKISDLVNDSEFMQHVDEEFPLQLQYNKILYDIRRDENTLKRYNEVEKILADASSEIGEKFRAVESDINSAVDKIDNLNEYDRKWLKNSSKGFGINTERAISQKRYFSMPENKQDGYCCKDPLLSKEAREEIVDTYLGYTLLSPFSYPGVESPLLNTLRNKYTISNNADNKFIDDCISRMTSHPEPKASGHNSLFHAFELAHLGKIFREAMGVAVK